MLANLATALFEHGRITTTEAKAKRLRPLAERLITFARRGDLHARRQVMTVVRDKDVVHTLFEEIGPRFAQRAGGYTRIVKVVPRKGDNAPMAVIELVEAQTVAQQAVGEAERARGSRFISRRARTRAAAGAAAGAESAEAGVVGSAEATEAGAEPVEADSVEATAVGDGGPVTVEAADAADAEQEVAGTTDLAEPQDATPIDDADDAEETGDTAGKA